MLRCLILLTCSFLVLAVSADARQNQPPAARDQYGDPLPAGASARAGTLRWRHDGIVRFAAFLPDGKSVVTVGDDKTIRVWEFPTGKEICRSTVPEEKNYPENTFLAAALSWDGKRIATFFGGLIHIHDVASGKEIAGLKSKASVAGQAWSGALAFSPGGEQLAFLDSKGFLRMWDLETGREMDFAKADDKSKQKAKDGNFGGGDGGPIPYRQRLIYAPNGKSLVTAVMHGDQKIIGNSTEDITISSVKVWDTATGAVIRSIATDDDKAVVAVAFSLDSKTLAISAVDGTITLWETVTGASRGKLTGEPGSAAALAFGGNSGKLYARSGTDRFVREWDIGGGKVARILPAGSRAYARAPHSYNFSPAMTVSPDGSTLVVAGLDQSPQFLDLKNGQAVAAAETSPGLPLASLRFTIDGKGLFTTTADGSIHKWDADTGKDLGPIRFPDKVTDALASPDGKMLAGMGERGAGLALFDIASGKTVAKLLLDPAKFSPSLQFSPDGKVLAARRAGDILDLYVVPTGKLARSLDVSVPVKAAEPGKGGAKGRKTAPDVDFGPPSSSATIFSPDGRHLAAATTSGFGYLGTFTSWIVYCDAATGQRLGMLDVTKLHTYGRGGGAFFPDGRVLAIEFFTRGTATIPLYELATGQARQTMRVSFDQKARIEIGRLDFVNETGPRVTVSPDGKLLAHAGLDRVVRLWDVFSGAELAAFRGHNMEVTAVAFSPSGKTLASASADTTVLIWDLTKVKRPARSAKALTGAEVEACWAALAVKDAAKAFGAIRDLAADPGKAVALIKDKVKPVAPIDPKRIKELIARLDDDQFQVREDANNELLRAGDNVLPMLDKALANEQSPEARKRLANLHKELKGEFMQGELLRGQRAVEILEHIGTPEARQVLQALAGGAEGDRLTNSAKAALKR